MADPVTLLLVSASAIAATGAISQGQAEDDAAKFNAALLEQNSTAELQQTGQREEAQRRQARQVLGAQRAALAESGGGMGGSAADVMQQSSANAELDALMMRYEGDLRARGMRTEAVMERYAGKQAKIASYYKAGGSVLSGAASYGKGAGWGGGASKGASGASGGTAIP